MAVASTTPAPDALLAATKACLRETGLAGLSTRRVAEAAGLPLSQIHYHFGSKRGLVLALLAAENERLLERQETMYGEAAPLWRRWQQACDFFDEDLESGYVHVLLEMVAAGWTDPEIAGEVRRLLRGWYDLLVRVAREATDRFGGLGPFTPEEVASLIGQAFLGGEALVLLGSEEDIPVRQALRRIGDLLKAVEGASEKEPST